MHFPLIEQFEGVVLLKAVGEEVPREGAWGARFSTHGQGIVLSEGEISSLAKTCDDLGREHEAGLLREAASTIEDRAVGMQRNLTMAGC